MKEKSGLKVSAMRRWLLAAGAAAITPLGVLVCAVLLWLLTAGLSVAMLLVSREDAWQQAIRDSQNLTLILERDILRSVELYDLSLRAVVEGAADPRIMSLPTDVRRQVLFERTTTAKYLGPITIYGPDGTVQVCSVNANIRRTHRPNVRWFLTEGVQTGTGLHISAPYASHTAGGGMVLALSRQITRPDGTFGGVVVERLSIDYFHDLLDGLSVGSQGGVSVLETDGTLLSRLPYSPNDVGKNFGHSSAFGQSMKDTAGSFVATASIDGVRRLYVYRHVRGLPFVVNVAPALNDIYASWRWRALWVALLMVLVTLAIMAGAWSLVKELRRRQATRTQLQRLAHRDALTGLENRGTFDEVWHREFLRAKRTGRPLSLLFLDIDHFKAYNDYYGHQAGDRTLGCVARRIASCGRRPGDHVARYGGEEFVVVLPETDAESAAAMAEGVRRAIYELDIEHVKSRFGRVTISIGVASSEDPGIVDETDLIRAADMATYDAKSNGRNRVSRHRASIGPDADLSKQDLEIHAEAN